MSAEPRPLRRDFLMNGVDNLFRLIKTEGRARRGEFTCPHGVVQTPVFMNVGTLAAIKGGLSARDLREIGCQIELSNTYHLHVRPGDALIKELGGLHRFMGRAHTHRQRGVPDFLPRGAEENQRGGRALQLACGREAYLHGPGGEHEDTVQPRL